jgi:predicted nucleic acid-binding Zn ribbon protein
MKNKRAVVDENTRSETQVIQYHRCLILNQNKRTIKFNRFVSYIIHILFLLMLHLESIEKYILIFKYILHCI